MPKSKSCGNCTHWIKIKQIKGLCDLMDLGWANSDHGKNCKQWQGMKYKRKKVVIEVDE